MDSPKHLRASAVAQNVGAECCSGPAGEARHPPSSMFWCALRRDTSRWSCTIRAPVAILAQALRVAQRPFFVSPPCTMAALLVFDLHGQVHRCTAEITGKQFQRLRFAASYLRRSGRCRVPRSPTLLRTLGTGPPPMAPEPKFQSAPRPGGLDEPEEPESDADTGGSGAEEREVAPAAAATAKASLLDRAPLGRGRRDDGLADGVGRAPATPGAPW